MRRMGEQEVRRGSRKVPLILSQATYAVDGNGRRLWRAGYWSGIDRDQAWRGNSQSHRRRDLVCSVGHLLHLASCAAERAGDRFIDQYSIYPPGFSTGRRKMCQIRKSRRWWNDGLAHRFILIVRDQSCRTGFEWDCCAPTLLGTHRVDLKRVLLRIGIAGVWNWDRSLDDPT